MQVDKGIPEPRASALGKPLCSLQKLESWGKRAPDYTLPSTPKTLQGFGLVSLKYPKENLSEKQRELHRFIVKQDPTSGTGRAV